MTTTAAAQKASSDNRIARWKLISAKILGGIVALFTALWLLIILFVILQMIGGVYEGGELVFVGVFLTAPPVFICSILAMILVGPKRCKMAWLSALLWLAPWVVSIIITCVVLIFKPA
jgi:hypothetical protein